MKPLKTHALLRELSWYDFFDWEGEEGPTFELYFGMPGSLLEELGVPRLHDSWGFEAVNNDAADPMFTPEKWVRLEDAFFDWLKGAADFAYGRRHETSWNEGFAPIFCGE